MAASVKDKLARLAERERRSLNKQIEFLLDRAIQEELQSEAASYESGRRLKQKQQSPISS